MLKPILAQSEEMSVWHEAIDGKIWVVGVNGRLDHEQTGELETKLTSLLNNNHHRIIVDLTETNYINSGGLRCLVSAWRRAKQKEGNLTLCGLDSHLQELFAMVGFDRVFPIYPDRKTAQKAMT